MLNELKNFNAERTNLDELVSLSAYARQLRNEYEQLQLDEPEWLDERIKTLRREIHVRNADKLAARKREIDARLEAVKTPAEKKRDLLAEKRKIDQQLAEISA